MPGRCFNLEHPACRNNHGVASPSSPLRKQHHATELSNTTDACKNLRAIISNCLRLNPAVLLLFYQTITVLTTHLTVVELFSTPINMCQLRLDRVIGHLTGRALESD